MGMENKEGSDRSVRSLVLKRHVQEAAAQYGMLRNDSRILIGLSGGADSVCLLRILLELKNAAYPGLQLRAVHVHHGLRQNADGDAAFVRSLCEQWDVPLRVVRVRAAEEAGRRGMSVEEAGRALRYESFRDSCMEWNAEEPGEEPVVAAVAHHLEDRAETVLFHLCRGSSIAGLAGIRPVSDYRGIRVIRPLIRCTREEIEAFLVDKGQPWREDETNYGTEATRNYIRLRILPALREHVNRESEEHIARTAEDVEEAEAYLKAVTDQALAGARYSDGTGCLSVSSLKELPPFLQKRVLYAALTEAAGHRKDITAEHVEQLRRLLRAEGSASVQLPYGVTAFREYDRLTFRMGEKELPGAPDEDDGMAYPTEEAAYSMRVLSYSGKEGDIPAGPYTKWVDYDKICKPVLVRPGQAGDVLVLDPDGHVKKLSRIMVDRKIPAGIRDRIMLPVDSRQHVLWIPGYRIGADVRVDAGTRRVLELSLVERKDEYGRQNIRTDPGRQGGAENPRTGSTDQQ